MTKNSIVYFLGFLRMNLIEWTMMQTLDAHMLCVCFILPDYYAISDQRTYYFIKIFIKNLKLKLRLSLETKIIKYKYIKD